MMKKLSIPLILFFCFTFWMGCGSSSGGDQAPAAQVVPPPNSPAEDPPTEPEENDNGSAEGRISFEDVDRAVIGPRCVECHGASGGVNLEGQSRVMSELEAIKRVVFIENRMPPMEEGPLTSEQRELLRKWIEQETR